LIIYSDLFSFSCYSADKYVSTDPKKEENVTLFSNGETTRKIVKRNEFQQEGNLLARQGRYEEALEKYKLAIDPLLLNRESDKSYALCAMRNIYKYQGKLDDALTLHDKYILIMNPKKGEFVEAHLEILALIKARDTKNFKPIYEYINYLKAKDKAKNYAIDSHADDLIHLYDYMHDYDSGIALMDEIIKYHANHPDKNHRSAHTKDVREYTRVKQAWELDKKTGQHGHLQDVIRTSDVISW